MARAFRRIQETIGARPSVGDRVLSKAIDRTKALQQEVAALRRKIMAYGEAMTGSSPSVFALVEAMTRAGTTAAAESRVFYTTFASVHEQTDHHCQQRFDNAFKTAVVAFLDEWEAELEAADAAAIAAERQCAEVEHYSAKVLSLHEAARAQTSKGRAVSSANAARLQRNEAKLEESKSTFGAARDAALTATHKVWASRRQCYDTVLLRLMQFERERARALFGATEAYDDATHKLVAAKRAWRTRELGKHGS
ncbi:hypothetical protein FNF29_04639 [Cafeteria roenbergensis]|uniref:BAR domain-containing protein n=2 Tax=Cafeteria roenbergensis TaxID=33653 RepID=A0A5A8CHW0_CAFRO|nr:hypothetical protein FNF29_04639 [Cafeteria roenbergensis]|eukprot:KAA0151431.1 hypothetical protein FNF29_04639 [Cafeteria roenbergensis]